MSHRAYRTCVRADAIRLQVCSISSCVAWVAVYLKRRLSSPLTKCIPILDVLLPLALLESEVSLANESKGSKR